MWRLRSSKNLIKPVDFWILWWCDYARFLMPFWESAKYSKSIIARFSLYQEQKIRISMNFESLERAKYWILAETESKSWVLERAWIISRPLIQRAWDLNTVGKQIKKTQWAHWPMGPWAHGPMGPWAHGRMGRWAHGKQTKHNCAEPMGPWARAYGPMGPWQTNY